MPLSEPVPREHLHTRNVECRGFLRDDGLWDIEGRMVDIKTYSKDLQDRADPDLERPRFLGTCHALASDSPIIKEHWPEAYTGSD